MSTPITPSQSIDDIINRARMELLGDTIPLPKGTGSSSIPSFGNIKSGSSTGPVDDVPDNVIPDWVKSLMGGASPLEAGAKMSIGAVEEIESSEAPIPTSMPGFDKLAPGGAGLTSVAGKAGVIRKTLASRLKGKKLVDELPAIQNEVAAMGDELYEVGANLWTASLKGMNPGQFSRFLSSIPEAKLPTLRAGMLEGLVENVANLPKLTKAAQQNLTSPAGRVMLRETLADMPEEAFTRFMSLLERGKFQEWRNKAFIISSIYPLLRFFGSDFWRNLIP